MTSDQLQTQIRELANEWLALLAINDFEVRAAMTEGEDTCNASTQPGYLLHATNFNIPRILWRLEHEPEFDLEEHVVHELVHAYTARVWQLSEQLVAAKDMQHAWHWMFEQLFEEATQRMSTALVKTKRHFA